MEKSKKLSRQAKENSASPNQLYNKSKGTSLGRKHKRRKRHTQNKPKTIKKMVIGSYIWKINLNVNELNTPTTRFRLTGWMRTCACMHLHLS